MRGRHRRRLPSCWTPFRCLPQHWLQTSSHTPRDLLPSSESVSAPLCTRGSSLDLAMVSISGPTFKDLVASSGFCRQK
jgi:hypothetical protein